MRRVPTRRLGTAFRRAIHILALAGALGLLLVVYEAAALNSAWQSVRRVSLTAHDAGDGPIRPGGSTSGYAPTSTETEAPDPAAGGSAVSTISQPAPVTVTSHGPAGSGTSLPTVGSAVPPGPASTLDTEAGEPPQAMALVGIDSRAGLPDLDDFGNFAGQRADVIILALRTDHRVVLLSVPRDLYVEDTCGKGRHRIGGAYGGCGDRPGLSHLVAELEQVTGIHIPHAAAVDLAGFQSLVDQLGGYEICPEHPLRDTKSGLRIPAGCHRADGETTLAWLRSRRTERYVDRRWEPVPDVSDLTRNERQRTFLMDMFDRLASSSGPAEIRAVLGELAPHLIVDDGLSLTDAAAWAWRLRSSDVEMARMPVRNETTPEGASILVPNGDVALLVDDLIG